MKSDQYKIVPLSNTMLNSAVLLGETIFPHRTDQKNVRWTFSDSLQRPDSGKEYWLAVNKQGKILGMTGLYIDNKDEKVVWLGWFGVHPQHRHQGLGSILLRFSITEAVKRGFSKLKLYTSSDKNELAAHNLYEKFGFIQSGIDEKADLFYYIKNLEEENTQ